MASSHYIVQAVASACPRATEQPKRLTLHVEVKESAPIKSETELLRATRAIAAEEIARAVGTKTLGELTAAETDRFDQEGTPLTSAEWPGTLVWRICASGTIAA